MKNKTNNKMKKLLLLLLCVPLLFSCGEMREWKCISGNCENGFGTADFGDYKKYVGEWKDGEPNGKGTLYNGITKYVGEFKDGNRNGKGTLTLAKGGYVMFKYKDEELKEIKDTLIVFKHEGLWKDDNKNGQGIQTHLDGSQYVGGFKNDFKHGQATTTFFDGTVEKGLWEYGEFIGEE